MFKNLKTITLLCLVFVTALDLFVYINIRDANSEARLEFTAIRPSEGIFDTRVAYISGAVKKPGTYAVNHEQRVIDLIETAGGYAKGVDIEHVNSQMNLALMVGDEQQIHIPFLSFESDLSLASLQTQNNLININSATQAELEELNGIGPATATKIIANRPYVNVDDLLNVPGIGEVTLGNIRNQITI